MSKYIKNKKEKQEKGAPGKSILLVTFGWSMAAFTLSEAKGYRGTMEKIAEALISLGL
jgi:hypothetical protein